MTATIYVDFENEEVYSQEEYEDVILGLVEEGFNGHSDYCWDFDEWLNEGGYTPSAIFHLNDQEKKNIIREYDEYADMTIRSNWRCEEKEIKI